MASIKEGSRSLGHSHMSNLPWSDSMGTVHVALTKTHSAIGVFLSMCTEREEGGEATSPREPCSWCCGTGAVVLPNATVTSETPHLGQPELWKPRPGHG